MCLFVIIFCSMKVVFLTNFINHHQVYLADELYCKLDGGYYLVATTEIPEERKSLGYPEFSDKPYLVKAYESTEMYNYAIDLVNTSDVVIIGSAPESMVKNRIQSRKLTFRYNERWFKSRPWYVNHPRGWINIYLNHYRYRNMPLYMLCASAFTSKDVNQLGLYVNKCFRWGYFTKVADFNIESSVDHIRSIQNTIHIMWCARFLKWKHPELPVKLAKRLKQKGYKFVIDMFGNGDLLESMQKLAKRLNVDDVVNFCGSRPNDEIHREMRKHDIFLFTSDRNEGWGAVLNEAMSNGCVAIGSDEIGAVPFLIEDGINGCVFKSCNLNSLEEKTIYLIQNPKVRTRMAINAYNTMRNVWSPENAAKQFLQLVQAIILSDDSSLPSMGPGSKI